MGFPFLKKKSHNANDLDLDPRLRCRFGVIRDAAEKVNYMQIMFLFSKWSDMNSLASKPALRMNCWNQFSLPFQPDDEKIICPSSSADDHIFSWIKSGFFQVVLTYTSAQSSALLVIHLPDAFSTAFIPYKIDGNSACCLNASSLFPGSRWQQVTGNGTHSNFTCRALLRFLKY